MNQELSKTKVFSVGTIPGVYDAFPGCFDRKWIINTIVRVIVNCNWNVACTFSPRNRIHFLIFSILPIMSVMIIFRKGIANISHVRHAQVDKTVSNLPQTGLQWMTKKTIWTGVNHMIFGEWIANDSHQKLGFCSIYFPSKTVAVSRIYLHGNYSCC